MRRESTVGERSAKHNKPAADELNQTLLVGLSSLSLLLANLTGLAIFVYGAVQVVGIKSDDKHLWDNTTIKLSA